VRKVRRILRQHRPDCVIFAGFIPALVYPFFLRPLTKARFIFWDHAPQNSFTHVKKALFPLSLRHIDRIVSISGSTASALTRLFGIRPERIAIVHNGIEPSRWRRLPAVKNFETLRIVMPARFDLNQKDPLTLIRAAALLHQEGIPVEVTLVGSGEGEAIMRHAIAEAKADSYITLLGHTDDVPALVARHNILCLSTHFEGLATVLLEGMLAGRLVIASAVPGCVDIVKDGYNGLLFKPGDAEDCARALKSAQTRSDVAVMIERGCKQVLEEFTPAAMVDGFLKVMIS
jgi:glycosyltransferase involved in cell wall biosynthesis